MSLVTVECAGHGSCNDDGSCTCIAGFTGTSAFSGGGGVHNRAIGVRGSDGRSQSLPGSVLQRFDGLRRQGKGELCWRGLD